MAKEKQNQKIQYQINDGKDITDQLMDIIEKTVNDFIGEKDPWKIQKFTDSIIKCFNCPKQANNQEEAKLILSYDLQLFMLKLNNEISEAQIDYQLSDLDLAGILCFVLGHKYAPLLSINQAEKSFLIMTINHFPSKNIIDVIQSIKFQGKKFTDDHLLKTLVNLVNECINNDINDPHIVKLVNNTVNISLKHNDALCNELIENIISINYMDDNLTTFLINIINQYIDQYNTSSEANYLINNIIDNLSQHNNELCNKLIKNILLLKNEDGSYKLDINTGKLLFTIDTNSLYADVECCENQILFKCLTNNELLKFSIENNIIDTNILYQNDDLNTYILLEIYAAPENMKEVTKLLIETKNSAGNSMLDTNDVNNQQYNLFQLYGNDPEMQAFLSGEIN